MIISVIIINSQNIKHLFFQSGQECNNCTSFGRYIYFEVGTGKKVSVYRLINDSVSVRSRDNSIGVLPRLRAGIPGSISGVGKDFFPLQKIQTDSGPIL
jgi:hypothetical protein